MFSAFIPKTHETRLIKTLGQSPLQHVLRSWVTSTPPASPFSSSINQCMQRSSIARLGFPCHLPPPSPPPPPAVRALLHLCRLGQSGCAWGAWGNHSERFPLPPPSPHHRNPSSLSCLCCLGRHVSVKWIFYLCVWKNSQFDVSLSSEIYTSKARNLWGKIELYKFFTCCCCLFLLVC